MVEGGQKEDGPVKRMVLIESDGDLAVCVTRFFADRFEVDRVATLEEASDSLRGRSANILFANIDSPSQRETLFIELIRRDYPQMKIIVTYLSPATGEPWEKRFNECVDVLVRKPYRILDVDNAIRELDVSERTRQ